MKTPLKPDLKIPDLKVPPFASDVYYDLRDRHLLPLVALVVVAIAAVPFLLVGDAGEVQPPSADGAGQPPIATTEARLTVVQDKPDLRDYRKRLRGRTSVDPFKQRYTSLPEEARLKSVDVTSEGGSVDGSSVESVVKTTPGNEGAGSSPGGGGDGGSSSPSGSTGAGEDGLEEGRLYGFRPDVRFGVAGSDELKLHQQLPLGSLLPRENPVLLFVGVTENGKRALFNLTPEVSLVRGDGDCVGGVRNCSILSMRVGQAVNLTTDQPGRSFRLKVERIEFVELPMPQNVKRPAGTRGGQSGKGWAQALSPSVVGQFESKWPIRADFDLRADGRSRAFADLQHRSSIPVEELEIERGEEVPLPQEQRFGFVCEGEIHRE